MRNWFGWAGLRAPMAALALGAVVAPSVSASPVETTTTAEPTAILRPLLKYSTVGTLSVDSGTVTGDNVIGFNNIVSQDFRSPSFFSLGEFQMIPGLGDDVTVTYNNTPFSITLGVESVDGSIPVINQTPVVLTGVLNGTITGPRQSTLEATFNFDPANPPSFQVGDFLHTLTRLGPVDIAPFTTNGGRTSIQGRLESVQVPEPASIAVFLVAAVGGYGLRRRARAPRGQCSTLDLRGGGLTLSPREPCGPADLTRRAARRRSDPSASRRPPGRRTGSFRSGGPEPALAGAAAGAGSCGIDGGRRASSGPSGGWPGRPRRRGR